MRRLILIVAVAAISGCNSYSITEKGTDTTPNIELPGVPFYQKKGRVKQTTVYTRSWVEITFELSEGTGDQKKVIGAAVRFAKPTADFSSCFSIASSAAQDKIKNQKSLADAVREFKAKYPSGGCTDAIFDIGDLSQEQNRNKKQVKHVLETKGSNTASIETYVDYTKKFYYNVKVWPFSSTNASIQIAADGSLTTATAATDTTKLADVLPLADIAKAIVSGGAGAAASTDNAAMGVSILPGAGGAAPKRVLAIRSKVAGLTYTLTKYFEPGKSEDPYSVITQPVDIDDAAAFSAIAPVSSSGEQSADANTVKFNGAVTLPKKQ